jgi:hypothetical protein
VVRGFVQIVAAIATQIRLFTADELATVSITAWQSVRTELHHHQHKRINNGIFIVPLIPTLLIWSRNFSSYLCRPRKYLQAMGFNMNQYAVVRHTDRDHDHAHIVASRVRLDGTTVSDSWDYHRSEAAIRQLEQEYGLRSLHSSQTKDSCSPKTGEQRLLARTGEESIRVQLQRSLDQVTQTPLTMPQLVKQLQQKGISVRISYCSTGEAKGISYELNGVAFSGTHLGKAYTFTDLQKYRRLEYIKERDGCCMQKLVEYPSKAMIKEHIEESSLSKVYTKKAERKKRSVQELEL